MKKTIIKTKKILWCQEQEPSLLQLQELALKDIRKKGEYAGCWLNKVVFLKDENEELFNQITNIADGAEICNLVKEFIKFITQYDAIILPTDNFEFVYLFAGEMAVHRTKKVVFIAQLKVNVIANPNGTKTAGLIHCGFKEITNKKRIACEHTNILPFISEYLKCNDCGLMLSHKNYFEILNHIAMKSTEKILFSSLC